MVHKVRGSITVFLSFILVMVLALVGTLLDVARVDMAESFAYRSLVSAVDTEFTKYCSELYEDYHIYMLGNGHNLSEVTGEEFLNSMTQYLMYSFDSDSNLTMLQTPIRVKGAEMLNLSVKDCKVEGSVSLADYKGKVFQDQVAQYMKYYMVGEAAEGILAKLNLLNQSKETMTVVRKKNQVDEKVAKVDKTILKLMQQVDGITFKNNQLVVTDAYKVKIQNSFAKKFCTVKVSPTNVGIHHNVLWDSLKGSYINPVDKLKTMEKELADYLGSENELKTLEDRIKKIDEALTELKHPETTQASTSPTLTVQSTPQMTPEQVENKIKELEKEKKDKQQELEKERSKKKKNLPNVRKIAASLHTEAEGIESHTQQAITLIDSVDGERKDGINALTSFGSYLNGSKDKLEKQTYDGLVKEYTETKSYMNNIDENGKDTSVVGNVLHMKPILSSNKVILENTVKVMKKAQRVSADQASEIKDLITQLISQYSSYSIGGLQFDYSTLTVREKSKSPLTSFSSLIGGGLLGLVIDNTDKLSNNELDSTSLVSTQQKSAEADKTKDEKDNQDMADKISGGEASNSGISDSLGAYEDNCESASIKQSGVNDIARKVLINEYGVTQFVNLIDDLNDSKKEEKKTKLKYEQEYLAIGQKKELDNVKSIVMRTIFMRTAVNYIALLTSSSSRSKAKATATVLVGFTGLAPLVLLTSQLILIAWAFEEGLVDTRILLDGKKVDFFTKADNFYIKFEDLLLVSKEMIKEKAKKAKQDNNNILAMSYNDYLRIYLLMVPSDTLSYRMMDLIQENMKVRYDPQFEMMNGIFGTKVSLTVTMPGKFLNIPFIKNFSGYDGADAEIKVSTEYSY